MMYKLKNINTLVFSNSFISKAFKMGFFILLLNFVTSLKSQDIHFSQYNAAPMLLNPALTGAYIGDHRIGLNFKEQWSTFTKYMTISAAYDATLFRKKMDLKDGYLGLGAVVFADRAGDAQMGNTQVILSAAYFKNLDPSNTFSFGAQGGFMQRNLNTSGLEWDNQYNGVQYDSSLPTNEPEINKSFFNADFSAGASWNFMPSEEFRLRLGAAVYHLNTPQIKYYKSPTDRLNRRIVVHSVSEISSRGMNVSFVPSILYMRQEALQELTFGGHVKYELQKGSIYTGWLKESSLYMGVYYRLKDAIIPALRIDYKNYSLGISYDISLSKVFGASRGMGGVEVSLIMTTPYFPRIGRQNGIPRF